MKAREPASSYPLVYSPDIHNAHTWTKAEAGSLGKPSRSPTVKGPSYLSPQCCVPGSALARAGVRSRNEHPALGLQCEGWGSCPSLCVRQGVYSSSAGGARHQNVSLRSSDAPSGFLMKGVFLGFLYHKAMSFFPPVTIM